MTESTTIEERPTTLDAHGLLRWAQRCVERLGQYREEINSLNVFPVPDSDTGTNLLHTMRAAVDQAEGEAAWTSEGGGTTGAREIAVALGHGAVHGARGNSGVILSQVLRAIGEAATFTVVDAVTLRRALRTAVTLVDHAISDPVEGTIVTVLREAAAGAARSTAPSLVEVARAAADAAAEALDRTPSQLPVLGRAGVVDAGARGLLVLLDTLVETLTGRAPERREYRALAGGVVAEDLVEQPTGAATTGEATRFEVMYSLTHTDDARADELRATLRRLGDSIVVVGDGGTGDAARWAVHVHTNDVGPAIESALALGRVSEIRVTDLFDADAGHDHAGHDHAGHAHDADGAHAATVPGSGGAEGTPERVVVAIVPEGPISDLFVDAGARVLDPGEDGAGIVSAVLAIPAEELLVLPNGGLSRARIIELDTALGDGDRRVIIVPTGSVVQGLSALAVHDPSTSLSLDSFGMADAAAATRHAHLVRAEEEALTLVGRCGPGDLLGMLGHDVAVIEKDPVHAVCGLADRMLASGGELVTLLLGDEFDAGATEEVLSRIRRGHPDADVVGYAAGPGRVLARIGVE